MPREDVFTHTEDDAGAYERFARPGRDDDRPWSEQYEPGDER